MDLGLQNKIAVITGGSNGIGLAIAESLAAEGAVPVIVARNAQRVEQAVKNISEKYGLAHGIAADVTSVSDIERIINYVTHLGGVDILINNAGTGSNETVMQADDEKWQAYWELHVMAAVRLARGLVPFMQQRGGGVILHNASICAVQPLWYEPIYNVTKSALMMFSKVLARELVPDNIRVNCVNLGLILTPDWIKTAKQLTKTQGGDWQGYLQSVADEHTLSKRFGTVQEAADFFTFLCSQRASYSIGSTYFVDGGMLKSI